MNRVVTLAVFAWVAFWIIVSCALFLGYDQINYQAAGERLNAGHLLYALGPGDRPVTIAPPYWTSPLLYPPLIAVIWRPLAALAPMGPTIWWLVNAACLIGATAFVASRSPLLVIVAAPGVGLTVAAGNVAGILVGGMVLTWHWRQEPRVGALVAAMAFLKVTPGILLVWLIASRRWRAIGWALATSVAALALSMLAGPSSLLAYVNVVKSTGWTPLSLTGLTGISSYVAAVIGGLLVLLLPDRWSFRAAVATSMLASPMIGVASIVSMLPLGADVEAPHDMESGTATIRRVSKATDDARARIAASLRRKPITD